MLIEGTRPGVCVTDDDDTETEGSEEVEETRVVFVEVAGISVVMRSETEEGENNDEC